MTGKPELSRRVYVEEAEGGYIIYQVAVDEGIRPMVCGKEVADIGRAIIRMFEKLEKLVDNGS